MILRVWRILDSFKGECYPIWWNTNQVCNRLDGGVSGFFRKVEYRHGLPCLTGNEFHGVLKWGETKVSSTETKEAIIADDYQCFNEKLSS